MAPTEKDIQDAEALARIDERTKHNHANIKFLIGEFKDFREHYVTKQEFSLVKRVVYGAVSLVLTGVGVALITLVVYKP
jgi:hypothetical protein